MQWFKFYYHQTQLSHECFAFEPTNWLKFQIQIMQKKWVEVIYYICHTAIQATHCNKIEYCQFLFSTLRLACPWIVADTEAFHQNLNISWTETNCQNANLYKIRWTKNEEWSGQEEEREIKKTMVKTNNTELFKHFNKVYNNNKFRRQSW